MEGYKIARKKRPTNIKSREDLIDYLLEAENEDPFNEECFQCALVETKRRNDIIRKNNNTPGKEIKRLEFLGNVYFELRASPMFMEKDEDDEDDKDEEIEEEPVVLNLEDYIPEFESRQGQFIAHFIERYFGDMTNEDTLRFLIDRIKSYYGEYELNSASDEFLVMTAIADELVIRDITKRRVKYTDIDNKELELIRNSYIKSLDGLKALKKFDKGEKESDSKFTVWVNKLVKGEELDSNKIEIKEDDIDRLIESELRGIRNVFL